jgi:TRAP-type C4-dicarboxylate transport system substrate-binding protein
MSKKKVGKDEQRMLEKQFKLLDVQLDEEFNDALEAVKKCLGKGKGKKKARIVEAIGQFED